MKEAAGEATITVVTISIIALIILAGSIIIPKLTQSSSKKGCCVSAGGYWITETSQCKQVGTGIDMSENTYWDSTNGTCKYQ